MTLYTGKWALITGASAGIGAAFARSLAEKGANLILVARREARLTSLADELSSKHNIQTKTISADLAKPDSPAAVMAELKASGTPIDILINNAGFGLPGEYLDSDWQTHRDFIELMVTSYGAFSHLALEGMTERGYGRIIQVASVAGLVPGAKGHTMYGATKAFLVSFAQSLAAEYSDRGVHTTALCPGFTYTEFHDVNGTRNLVSKLPNYMMMPAEPVVEGALRAVEKRHVVYVPGSVNKMIVWLMNSLPRSWAARLMTNNSKRIRKSAET